MAMLFLLVLAGATIGVQSFCTDDEKETVQECYEPHSLVMASLITGGKCDKSKITSDICTNTYAEITECLKDVSPLCQVITESTAVCKSADFKEACSGSGATTTNAAPTGGGAGSAAPSDPGGGGPGTSEAPKVSGGVSTNGVGGEMTCTVPKANGGGSIHGGWSMAIVVAVAHFLVVLSTASLR